MTCFQPEPLSEPGNRLDTQRVSNLEGALGEITNQITEIEAALDPAVIGGLTPDEIELLEFRLSIIRGFQFDVTNELSLRAGLSSGERSDRAYELAAIRWLKTQTAPGALHNAEIFDPIFQFLTWEDPFAGNGLFNDQLEAAIMAAGNTGNLEAVRLALGNPANYNLFLQITYREWLLQVNRPYLFKEIGVLLPLRIETIFKPNADGSDRMFLRIIPDEISIDRHNPFVSQAEINALTEMWQAVFENLSNPDTAPPFWLEDRGAVRLAWSQFCSRVGPGRAAYLAETYLPQVQAETVTVTVPDEDRQHPDRPFCNRVSGFPDQIEVWIEYCDPAQPDSCEVLPTATLNVATDRLFFDLPRDGDESDRWWVSWETARDQVGLGVEVDLLRPKEHIRAIYAAGIGEASPTDHFRALARSGEMGLMGLGDATNTVHGAPAADLGTDPEKWRWAASLELQRRAGETRFAPSDLTSRYLTGDQNNLPILPTPQADVWMWSDAMVRALWPALWGHFLRDVWELGDEALHVGSWATHFLLPEGPLPPVRVGEQPYGVLPVSAFRQWRADFMEGPQAQIEERMLRGLLESRAAWARAARMWADRPIGAEETHADRLLDVLGQDGLPARFIYRQFLPLELIQSAYHGIAGLDPQLASLGFLVGDYMQVAFETAKARMERPPGRHYAVQGDPKTLELPLIVPTQLPQTGIDPDGGPVWLRFIEAVESIVTTQDWDELRRRFMDFDAEAFAILPDSLLLRLMIYSRWLAAAWAGQSQNGNSVPIHPPLASFNPHERTPLELAGTSFNQNQLVFIPAGEIWMGAVDGLFTLGKAVEEALEYTKQGPVVRDDPFAKQRITALERSLKATLDAAGRVDPWFTGMAWRRNIDMSTMPDKRLRLGVYGWVEGPVAGKPGPLEGGLMLAPSHAQALTSVVLRDRYLTAKLEGDPQKWQMNVDSRRVRHALEIAEEVRLGAHPWEALGRRVERIVVTGEKLKRLRQVFPLRSAQPGANTPCNGWEALLALVDPTGDIHLTPEQAVTAQDLRADLTTEQTTALQELRAAMDTWADLLVAEGVHAVVTDRASTAGAAMDAASGVGPAPTLGFTHTPQPGLTRSTRVLVALPYRETAPAGAGPAALADPSLAAYLAEALGGATEWDWSTEGTSVSLADLELEPADTLALSKDQIEALALAALSVAPGTPLQGSGTARHRLARQFVQAVGRGPAQATELEWRGEAAKTAQAVVMDQGAALDLNQRYTALRAAAQALIDGLQAAQGAGAQAGRSALREALRWGITPEAETSLAQALYGPMPVEPEALAAQQARLDELLGRAATSLKARLKAAPDLAAAPISANAQQEPRLIQLARAIAELAAPEGQIAVLCPIDREEFAAITDLKLVAPDSSLDAEWLSTIAAVRPALANLEALQLEGEYLRRALPLPTLPETAYAERFGGLQAWSSTPDDPWGEKLVAGLQGDARMQARRLPPLTAVYAPPGALPAKLAVGAIDRWSEVIPLSQRSVTAAFEFNAPAARPQQAILLAVPPEIHQPITNSLLLEILQETRELVKARAAQPEDLGPEGNLAPSTLLQAAGRTGVRLDTGIIWD